MDSAANADEDDPEPPSMASSLKSISPRSLRGRSALWASTQYLQKLTPLSGLEEEPQQPVFSKIVHGKVQNERRYRKTYPYLDV